MCSKLKLQLALSVLTFFFKNKQETNDHLQQEQLGMSIGIALSVSGQPYQAYRFFLRQVRKFRP